jgi:hypothetical protein
MLKRVLVLVAVAAFFAVPLGSTPACFECSGGLISHCDLQLYNGDSNAGCECFGTQICGPQQQGGCLVVCELVPCYWCSWCPPTA